MKKVDFNNRHEIITTKHVFSENNQVYLRKDDSINEGLDEWFSVNFQWIQVVELAEGFK